MLPTGKQKLLQDLRQIEIMVGEMMAYLTSEVLFWPTGYARSVTLTPGNYLIRQNRLLALRSTALSLSAQDRLDFVMACFDQVLYYKIDEFKQKMGQELEVRLRQWRNYIQHLDREEIKANLCDAEIENRVIIEEIFQKLFILTCQPDAAISGELEQLDFNWRQRWQPGKFIWPVEWESAYPQPIYWWLYGQLQNRPKVNMPEQSMYLISPSRIPSAVLSVVAGIGSG